jgi:hypothetical protein
MYYDVCSSGEEKICVPGDGFDTVSGGTTVSDDGVTGVGGFASAKNL